MVPRCRPTPEPSPLPSFATPAGANGGFLDGPAPRTHPGRSRFARLWGLSGRTDLLRPPTQKRAMFLDLGGCDAPIAWEPTLFGVCPMRRGSRRRHRRNRQEWSPQGNPQGNPGAQGNQPQGSRGPVRDPRQVQVPTEGETFPFVGIAEVTENVGGFVRQANQNYLPSREDVVIPPSVMRE